MCYWDFIIRIFKYRNLINLYAVTWTAILHDLCNATNKLLHTVILVHCTLIMANFKPLFIILILFIYYLFYIYIISHIHSLDHPYIHNRRLKLHKYLLDGFDNNYLHQGGYVFTAVSKIMQKLTNERMIHNILRDSILGRSKDKVMVTKIQFGFFSFIYVSSVPITFPLILFVSTSLFP